MASINDISFIASRNFDKVNSSANVVVKGFGSDALKGILEAISKTNSAISGLRNDIQDIQDSNDTRDKANDQKNKNDNKYRVASLASERRSRATAAAVYGEIKRGNVFNKMLREGLTDALNGLTSFLKTNLSQSLKVLSDLSVTMRKANLSQSDKDTIQRSANVTLGNVSKYFNDLQVSRGEINSYFEDLVASGKTINAMNAEQQASFIALRKSGMDIEKAYTAAMTTSAKALEGPINTMRNHPGVAQAMNESLKDVTSAQVAAMGGWGKTLNAFSKNSETYIKNLGMSGVATGDAAELIRAQAKLTSGIYDQFSDAELKLIPIMSNNMQSSIDSIKNQDTAFYARLGVINDSWANLKMMQDAGVNTSGKVYSEAEVGENNRVNTTNGRLPQLFDNLMAGLDESTGGLISSFTNRIDELFGGSVDIVSITSAGFKIVAGLLGSILAGKFLSGFSTKLFSALGTIASAIGVGGFFGSGPGIEDLADLADFDGPDKESKNKSSKSKGKSSRGGKGKIGKLAKGAKAFGSQAAKFGAKAIPVAGIALAAGDAAVDLYDAYTWEAESLAIDASSEAFKKIEEGINQSTKNGKVAAATAGAIGTFGGMAAGAAIGSAVPIVGTAIGAVVGLGVGAISSAIADAHESLNNTKIHIGNVKDLEAGAKELEDALAREQDPLRIKELREALEEQRRNIEYAKNAQMDDLVKKFNEKNEDFSENSAAMSQIGSLLTQSDAEITKLKAEIEDKKNRGYTNTEIQRLQNKLDSEQKKNTDYLQALTGLAGGEFKLKEGESLDAAIKRIAEDVRGDGWFDTREDVEFFAAKDRSKADKFLIEQATDRITNGVMHESLDDLKLQNIDTVEKFVRQSNLSAGLTEEGIKKLTFEVIKMSKDEAEAIKWQRNQANEPVDINLKPNALGGLYTNPTAALVGEAGREAVLPLENPDALIDVLGMLTNNERVSILKSLLLSGGASFDKLSSMLLKFTQATSNTDLSIADKIGGTVPGDDPATINRILDFAGPFRSLVFDRLLHGWKGNYKDGFEQRKKWYDEAVSNAANQSGRDLIRGTYAERALAWGVSQLGKPYILQSLGKIGYVCNELTDTALRASGFDMKDFHIYGVSATFDKLKSGRRSKLKRGDRAGEFEEFPDFRIRDDLTPETAIPGMLFFQTGKGKSQPGHIGLVYYGHQKLHSSGGSADYTKSGFLSNWQTPCRGVTVTPFDNGNYIIGELPGLFAKASGEFNLPEDANFGPAAIKKAVTDKSSGYDLVDFINNLDDIDGDAKLEAKKSYLIKEYMTAIEAVKNSSSNEAQRVAAEFSKSAIQLLDGKTGSADVLAALNSVIKYLRDIASSPSNKKVIPSVSRPLSTAY